ncbi:MAG: NAD(P)-dependent oxidoreductase [Candidatus Levybacteria bacterium]|nr:NAD(P)-dependent oxidoreductase [Candidatus Levybacteria bacterium]
MRPHVLITGGSGFLGVHVARLLLKKDFKVTLFDIAPLDAKDLIGNVEFIKGDVRKKNDINSAMKNVTHVIHAAAALPIQRTKQKIYSVNVNGTKRVLEAASEASVKRLVFISTTALYGIPKHLPETEESPMEPIGQYGQSKLLAEHLCKEFIQKGLDINIIRPKTFLGPERLGVFSLWFEAIYTGRRVFVLGKGNNKYQLLAVSDVADAIYKALISDVTNEIFNIGAKEYQTWRKDLSFIIKSEKSQSKITGLPVIPSQVILKILEVLNLSPIAAWHYKTMPIPSYVSIEKAQKLLHWTPKKSNKELLLESYLWYKKNRNKIHSKTGDTHRASWNFRLLNIISRI